MGWFKRLFRPSLSGYASDKVGRLAAFWVAVNATQPEWDEKDKAFWILRRDAESERNGLDPFSDVLEEMWQESHKLADKRGRPWDISLLVVFYVAGQYSLKLGRSATPEECAQLRDTVTTGWERLRQTRFPDL